MRRFKSGSNVNEERKRLDSPFSRNPIKHCKSRINVRRLKMSRIIVRNLLVLSSPRNNVCNRHQSDQDIHRSKSREYFSSKFNEDKYTYSSNYGFGSLGTGRGGDDRC